MVTPIPAHVNAAQTGPAFAHRACRDAMRRYQIVRQITQ